VPRCASIVFVSTNDDKGQLTITWSSQKRLSQTDVARLSINPECDKTQFLTGIRMENWLWKAWHLFTIENSCAYEKNVFIFNICPAFRGRPFLPIFSVWVM